MKWYSVELVDDSSSKLVVYKEELDSGIIYTYDSVIDYWFTESNSYIKGYCDCLESFGYKKWSGWNDKV